MPTVCEKCKTPIALNVSAIQCNGFCENTAKFHIDCVGLSYAEAMACMRADIMWMCDCCRELLKNIKFRNIIKHLKPIEDSREEIDRLRLDIAKINDTLSRIIRPINNDSTVNVATNSHVENEQHNEKMSDVLSSTRIHRSTLNESSQDCTEFSLFVSNIAPDVTNNQLKTLICEKLNITESLPVKRLVSPWKDPASLQYISFKVDLDRKYKNIALDSTIWPRGVRCREFKSFQQSSWRPACDFSQSNRPV